MSRLLSIIIPVLNEESSIERCLTQLTASNPGLSECEVLVIDGGSTDLTLNKVSSLGLPFVSILKTAAGRARQMNAGAAQANGEILLFLHADTILPPAGLATISAAIKRQSYDAGYFNVRLDNPGLAYRVIGAMINLRNRLFGGFTGDQAIFIRKELFERIGGYKEIPICEDLDLARRLQKDYKVTRVNEPVITSARRWEKNGLVRTILLMWKLRILFYAGVDPHRLVRLYADVR